MKTFVLTNYCEGNDPATVCVVSAPSLEKALPLLKEKAVAWFNEIDVEKEFAVLDFQPYMPTISDGVEYDTKGQFPVVPVDEAANGVPEFYDEQFSIVEVEHFIVE